MADPQRRSTRRQKIEPLNYAEAALSPALKGMTSFLDVSPENVRNGTFQEFGPAGQRDRTLAGSLDRSDILSSPSASPATTTTPPTKTPPGYETSAAPKPSSGAQS